MKTLLNVTRNLTVAALSLAALALVSVPAFTTAQEKGAERLVQLNRPAPGTPVAETAVMACPKCTDTLVTVAQPPGRGGRIESASIVRHQCPTCATKIVTEGNGKQAKNVLKHECKMEAGGSGSCCATKKL